MSTKLNLDEQALRGVVEDVLARLGQTSAPKAAPAAQPKPESKTSSCSCQGKHGVFDCADAACAAAQKAFLQLKEKGMEARAKVIDIVKGMCARKTVEWGKLEFAETKIGRLDHKIEKLEIIKLVPGVEWLRPDGYSGDHGITMEEYTPFGVVGAVTPVTHSIPTLSGNIISIVGAGNSVVFNPHPAGAKCAVAAVKAFNEAISREVGIDNLVCVIAEPTLESFNMICQNEHVRLMSITGGPGVVQAAMKSGKRSICAGPGNPPVVVDASAKIEKAARDVIKGAAYDNNLLCIGEKEIFVVDSVFNQFMTALQENGGAKLTGGQLDRLTEAVFTYQEDGGGCSHPVLNRDLVGADPKVLAQHAGTSVPANTQILFAETDAGHPFVMEEQMTPMIPIVRVRDVEEGIACSIKAEHGYKHSSMIHTLNVDHMTAMARAMDSTLFVKNGPCMAGLGLGGQGFLSYSIATTTGEGITTPKTFTRVRRCVMVDNLRIY